MKVSACVCVGVRICECIYVRECVRICVCERIYVYACVSVR